MASTLEFKPKGNLSKLSMTRATNLRHTFTRIPTQDCIVCSTAFRAPIDIDAIVKGTVLERRKSVSKKDEEPKRVDSLYCPECLDKVAQNYKNFQTPTTGKATENITSYDRLGLSPKKAGKQSEAVLMRSILYTRDQKPRKCGFCPKWGNRLKRYCVNCKCYLCADCMLIHQKSVPGSSWNYHRHATIALTDIKNTNIM